MQMPGVHIESLHNPRRYTYAQIDGACAIAQRLGSGKPVLVEPPKRCVMSTSCASSCAPLMASRPPAAGARSG